VRQEDDSRQGHIYNCGVDAHLQGIVREGTYEMPDLMGTFASERSFETHDEPVAYTYTTAAYYEGVYQVDGQPYSAPIRRGLVQQHAGLLPGRPHDVCPFPVPKRPLNVIHVGPFFLKGGAEQWLLDFVANVDQRYLRVTRCISIYPDMIDANYVASLAALGVTLECGGIESVREAAHEADVLLSWGIELDHFLGDAKAPLSVQVVHGDGPSNRRFLQRSLRSIDHAVAVSHRVRSLASDLVPTTTIYNGIDASRIAPTRSRADTRRALGFREHDFVVGFCGRLAVEKRPHVIVDAVSQLPSHAKVLLVGWGQLLPELQQMCGELLPERHVITYADKDIGDLYRAMDAFCMTSNQEGFSLALLEAMLCELPVVSTPVGCVPEFITDHVTGLLTDGSASHLAEMLSLLDRNRQWSDGLASEGYLLAQSFGYARRMARDYEHLLHHLWASKEGGLDDSISDVH
jgi:glycosyltransferase involved in cell wall biosynthesis